mmetsp:Transcript_11670/g.16539  ORF Transcript_11670/g.16539 Transcript_11670/m.16539 type:complete len:130 (-) Transcript_11670:2304-2693(-)
MKIGIMDKKPESTWRSSGHLRGNDPLFQEDDLSVLHCQRLQKSNQENPTIDITQKTDNTIADLLGMQEIEKELGIKENSIIDLYIKDSGNTAPMIRNDIEETLQFLARSMEQQPKKEKNKNLENMQNRN